MNRLYFAFITLLSFVYVSSTVLNDIQQCYYKVGSDENDAGMNMDYCIKQLQLNQSNFKWLEKNVIYKPNVTEVPGNANNLVTPRMRKEYRLLSDKERYDFLRSIHLLKKDKRMSPNVYDAIAFLHTGETARNAHAGPPFFLWHRIYLKMMEDALREKVPSVTIPFWDPTLDSSLPNPRDSTMWLDELMGTINGFVNTGPFANWKTPAGNLIRNGGFSRRLPTRSNIEDVLTRTKLEEISEPNAEDQYNLESLHNSMHVAIGGHMSMIPSSPMDPMFWLLHSYVELVYTRFNENQRKHNVDPATDYPSDYGLNIYAPNQSIGLMNLTIAEALKNTSFYPYLYKYDDSYLGNCTLNPNLCNSPYLTCNDGKCESKPRESTRCGTLIPYQNMFCINRRCDLDEWAFIPVEIIYERPFDTIRFGNFPIKDGVPNLLNDLYDDNQPQNSSNRNSSSNSNRNNCQVNKCCGPAGRLNIRAIGINYFGTYEEMAVVDRRLAVSSDIAYLGIRNPQRNHSLVFLAASEQCGRMCRPSCLVPGSNPPRYTSCLGLLNITRNNATFYGKTLAEAYMKVWDYKNQIRPKIRHENIPIVFHCDDSRWPFINNTDTTTTTTTTPIPTTTTTTPIPTTTTTTPIPTTTTTTPIPTTTTTTPIPTTTTTTPIPTTTTTTPIPTTTTITPIPTTTTTTPIPTTTTSTTTTTKSYQTCSINKKCTINKGCDCTDKKKYPCINSCNYYAICSFRKYFVVSCGYGRRFEKSIGRCIRGYCH